MPLSGRRVSIRAEILGYAAMSTSLAVQENATPVALALATVVDAAARVAGWLARRLASSIA
jgi:hypothetical protein